MNNSTQTHTTRRPAAPVTTPIKILAWVMLIAPVLGIIAIAYIWSGGYDRIRLCKDNYILHAMTVLGTIDFLGSFFLYQRARLPALIFSRLLSIAWVILQVVMLWTQIQNHAQP
jgi:hypothetical protein